MAASSCKDSKNPDLSFLLGKWLSSPAPGEEVVISGLSGQFPNSRNICEFHDNLKNKIEMIDGDDRRWKLDHPEIPQRTGKIYNINKLDAGFFGIHYTQAVSMDPILRVVLQSVIEAVVDAGVNPAELEGTKTGVFLSVSWSDVAYDLLTRTTERNRYPLTGSIKSVIANRVSYVLKLKGSSYNLDTACSSSLNAMDSAFRAIRTGTCDKAIVSTCNLILHPGSTIQFFRLGVLSSEGRCRVFDQDAKGYVRSEAAASVFLQKAKDSRRTYAEIIHCKVNCDGYKDSGITFPSSEAQKNLMFEIYNESGLAASDLSFIEAHGTGTQVGDIQEVEAIDVALAKFRNTPLLVGSVKSSIGHTEPSSGVCSLTKVILAMETGKITPNINLKNIKNGMKGFEEGRMIPVVETTDLVKEDAIIGINNFGFGGNNAHIIMKRYNKVSQQTGFMKQEFPSLVCVSGRTPKAVISLLNTANKNRFHKGYIALLQQLHKVDFTGHLYRGFTILDKAELFTSSSSLIKEKRFPLYLFFGYFSKNISTLGKDLLGIPIFESTIKKIDKILKSFNVNVVDAISRNETDDNFVIATSVQLGIAALLIKLELRFTAVYGDAMGKLTAAFYYNVITLKEAILAAVDQAKNVSKGKIENNVSNIFSKHQNDNARQDSFDIEDWANNVKNSIIVNVSDANLGKSSLRFTNAIQFLEILGRVYEEGYNFQIPNLYPETDFPVNRGTPMLSPSIKWNNEKLWETFKFSQFTMSNAGSKSYNISYFDEDKKYIRGHVVDGRNLVPATEYLYLVWERFADLKRMHMMDCSVVFEDCKFLKASAMQKARILKFHVSIRQGTGFFNIIENGALVVKGKISLMNEDHSADAPGEFTLPNDSTQILEQDEIYKELYLRGYNYSGLFKGLTKCNVEGTCGLIKWENNFTAFMDNMLQLSILQTDSRLLFVPVVIKKLVLDCKKHLKITAGLQEKDMNLPVYVCRSSNVIKSGGIAISGVNARSIARKPQQLKPVLEKYEFIPNTCSLDIAQIIRINTQIILENSLEINFKAVELIDNFSKLDTEFLLPLVCQTLDDIPLVNPLLTISTKQICDEIPGINIDNVLLTPDANILLIVGSNLLQRLSTLKLALSSLGPNGFVLSRENFDFDYNSKIEDSTLEVFTEYTTATEKIILLKKREQQELKTHFIEIDESLRWFNDLQTTLSEDKVNVVIYAKNAQPNGILGLVNCIRREPGGSRVKCFFTFDKDFRFDLEKFSQQTEMSFNVFKNYIRGTYRHLLLNNTAKNVRTTCCFVNNTIKGDLSSLKWFAGSLSPETPLSDKEVLVYTHYSALNFKDIMMATGRIGPEVTATNRLDQECVLGVEFSGKDVGGRKLTGMIDSKAISTMLISDKNFLWNVPYDWTLEEAATVPAVYCTVVYALIMVAKMKRGSSILIHSAAGGIGLATINVCRYFDCEVFLTVGTQEKKNFLKEKFPEIDDDHIGNSRDVSFEDMIKRGTKGRGVDIVLNSLAEEKLKASVRCLAHGGYFLEIGKFDLANDNSLELLFLEKEIHYHGIMFDQIYLSSVEIKKQLHKLIENGMNDGFIKPLPRVIFKKEEVEQAFRYMTKGKHIGKVLIKIRDEDEETDLFDKTFTAVPRFNCDVTKSYVVIGGLGGFGLELADWLILRGARKLILSSRNGVQTGYQTQRINIWRSYGATVHVVTSDATTEQGCNFLIYKANSLGPVDAVFNLAVILQDALINDQTEEMFKTVLAPKAQVTKLLDALTRKLCPQLRYFVVFSSVACGRGNIGQPNYGMANSIMERICERRKSEGLPALAIQWGAIGDVGLVAKMQKENKELVIGGTLQQKLASCFEVLDKFLTQDHPVVSSMMVAVKSNRGLGIVSAVEAVAQILGIDDVKTVSQHSTLPELGLDSLKGTEIIQVLEKDFDIYITITEVKNLTFAKLEEIEAEKKGTDAKSKTDQGAKFLVQFIPDNTIANAPSIVKMQSQIGNDMELPTVFVFPGMEGVLKPLEPFAKKLKANVFGIQYSYQNLENSIEDFANSILQNMNPYMSKDKTINIIAYSFGANIGVEIVHLLESTGYTVRLLTIDGSPSYLKMTAESYIISENKAEFEIFLLNNLLQNLLPQEIILQNKEKLMKCQDFLERANYALSLIPPDVIKKFNFDTQGAIILYKRIKAVLKYEFVHQKIKSVVHLLKAKIPMVVDEDDYGFSKICEKPVDVTVVDGNHGSIVNHELLVETVNKFIK